MPSDITSVIKVVANIAKVLHRPLRWVTRRLPGLFPAAALTYILLDVILSLPSSAEYRKLGLDILRFDGQATVNVFHMKSSRGTLPGRADQPGRPDPVPAEADLFRPVELPGRTNETLVPHLNADDFHNTLLFLTEWPDKLPLAGHGGTPTARPTLDVKCLNKIEDRQTFVDEWLYFAAPRLGYKEISQADGPELAFNQQSRVFQIGLSPASSTQMIQSDVPNLDCTLFAPGNIPISAVRLIGERRITRYVVIALGAIALWIAGVWVLVALKKGVAILE